jgi:hypothetical protein
MQSFLGLNGMGNVPYYSMMEQATEPKSYGYAGFFFCATTLVGNLILSNLIVNILGERYANSCIQLEKSKRKLQIDNFVRHGRHVLLSKLYFQRNKDRSFPFGWIPKPFFPWLGNKSVSLTLFPHALAHRLLFADWTRFWTEQYDRRTSGSITGQL